MRFSDPALCFFVQAEDGIRAGTVTGVQTCALPIFGAYTAGLLATRGWGDPLLGLGAAALLAAGAGFVSSFLVLRGADLTRLMVTLGVSLMLFEAANKLTDLTGGVDG